MPAAGEPAGRRATTVGKPLPAPTHTADR